MAGHLMVSTMSIDHSESVFLGHNAFLNESQRDSFFFGPISGSVLSSNITLCGDG